MYTVGCNRLTFLDTGFNAKNLAHTVALMMILQHLPKDQLMGIQPLAIFYKSNGTGNITIPFIH